ncbi:NAD-dependent deacetylase sirtuin-2 [Piedraia hortae CBS 480.64]|uniref:NAD-dependent protein deacetylase n=1 Tax=Piedraia hortae CBS 480.64 TaxID=1314780 RepID=A0A6A7BVV4_9PEZI|nr:NAD-dependent deacetylase sirtuin-2 [Piedraia hortae CBS 480.64]
MGNLPSTPLDPSIPPLALTSRTLPSAAAYLKTCTRIVILAGAGMSTSAGIPDFRSPGTGLYANLASLNLPHPEAVFELEYFKVNPTAFYTLAWDLYPAKGRYKPTLAHAFLRLLDDKGVLLRVFTQNIDTLERVAGVEGSKIVEAHGSFATQRCVECKAPFGKEKMEGCIQRKCVPRCGECGGLVKPNIVFFGEQLPARFFEERTALDRADFCLVIGTSLSVQPFAMLHSLVREGVPRILINNERVGDFGQGRDDVLLIGECDDMVRELAKECGWLEELEALHTRITGVPEGEEKSADKKLEEEVEKLTEEVDQTLRLSKNLTQKGDQD